MAECGSPPRLDQHLLECPICLEQLQQPKSLPCLHTFCQECLGTYINKELSGKMASETSFSCPVCRQMTQPVNQGDAKYNWAQLFPTNGLIQELAQLNKKSAEPFYCKPCKTNKNIATPAKFWCKTMDVLFCHSCKTSIHDMLHDDCITVDITGSECPTPGRKHATPQCGKHNEKMDCYCKDHQLIGCSKCVFIDHRRCDDVTTTAEYFEKLKKASNLEDMKNSLLSGVEIMTKLVKEFGEQLDTMLHNQDAVLLSITDLRQRIDRRIDQLQKDITDELTRAIKEEKNRIQDVMQRCERLMTAMQSTLMLSSRAVERNDNIEAILLYQRGQMEVVSCKIIVREMCKSFSSVSIQHQVDQSLAPFDKPLGKLVVWKEPKGFPDLHRYLASRLSGRCAKEIGTFSIKSPSDTVQACWAYGVVYLMNNRIVVSDYNNGKLKLFTDRGQYLDGVRIGGNPCDICLVDNNTVAVAVERPGSVLVVKVDSSSLHVFTEVNMGRGKRCVGITYLDGRFVVSTGNGGEVYSLRKNGTADLLHIFGKPCYHLARAPGRGQILVSVYASTAGNVVVSKLTVDKRHADMVTVGVLNTAVGIDVDSEGNIYTCGRNSNNVVQMSGEGTHVRELLTSSSPQAISVCGDKFVVTNTSSNQRNNIRVFQLV